MSDDNMRSLSFDEALDRMIRERRERDPRVQQVRVDVEERILESVEGGSYLTLRQVQDWTNEDTDSFILGQGAIAAALDRMAAKGLVTIIPRTEVSPRLYKFPL